jgi:undecaprenyl phosphate N,N'-diacetylbacillosamine 1-phosphate transferase
VDRRHGRHRRGRFAGGRPEASPPGRLLTAADHPQLTISRAMTAIQRTSVSEDAIRARHAPLRALPTVVDRRYDALRKRAFDVIIGLLLALLTLPLMIGLAIGSAIAYRAWPIFRQPRVGRCGGVFHVIKIRSLPASTPTAADKYSLADVANNRWGRALRTWHLDELPQLWLVPLGRMSLVGPRPEMLRLSRGLPQAFVSERGLVRPGCTGLWQISLAGCGLIGEAPEYDLHYVRTWTFRCDLWIVGRSVLVAAGARPIESVRDVPRWTGASVGDERALEEVPREFA